MEFVGTTKDDGNDNCCSSSPCPEVIANSTSDENASEETNVLRNENHENTNVQKTEDTAEDTAPTTLQDIPKENVDFNVIYNKQKININFALDGTVAELKAHLQNIISVPQIMQKVMFKGLAKDDQTLRSLGVTKGAKVMIVGSKLDDVLLAVSVPSKQDLADEASSGTSKERLSQQKIHRKVLDKGLPDDVMPGVLGTMDPLPDFPIWGMNKSGGKVRLTFKLEQDQLWIGTKERTDKIPMNSIKGVYNEAIDEHPEYHIVGIQLGTTEASRYWIYWVPAQYVSAITDAILGKWCYF